MKTVTIFFVLMLSRNFFSQVIISPYILYTDTKNKFGAFTVQNESNEIYEIDISFIFGYPVTDSVGNPTMNYIDQPDSSMPSIVGWIKAFPRKFVLNPGQKQIVRMTVKPTVGTEPGTYWSRIITSASPQSVPIDTLKDGVRAQIKFVLNQITTFLYRVEPTTTGIEIQEIRTDTDSNNVNVYANLIRRGNSPFFGDVTLTVRNTLSEIVAQEEQSLANYFNFVKKFQFPREKFSQGEYKVELRIVSNEKEEFPESTLEPASPVTKYLTLIIP